MARPPLSLRAQQAWLCSLLLGGLAAYLLVSMVLRSGESIQVGQNLDDFDRAALQLFIPYLGVAVGGLFGVARLPDAPPDPYRFRVAAITLTIWDLLVVGHVLLVFLGREYVEDFIKFAETILPVLSPLVAAVMAYYFGAHGAVPDGKAETQQVAGAGNAP